MRVSTRPPAERAAILAEIERQYRAALRQWWRSGRLARRPRIAAGRSLARCGFLAGLRTAHGADKLEVSRRMAGELEWLARPEREGRAMVATKAGKREIQRGFIPTRFPRNKKAPQSASRLLNLMALPEGFEPSYQP